MRGRSGALEEAIEAAVGKGRAFIGADRVQHLLVAALDEDVGDALGQACALGDGDEMLLRLGDGDGGEIGVGQDRGQ